MSRKEDGAAGARGEEQDDKEEPEELEEGEEAGQESSVKKGPVPEERVEVRLLWHRVPGDGGLDAGEHLQHEPAETS